MVQLSWACKEKNLAKQIVTGAALIPTTPAPVLGSVSYASGLDLQMYYTGAVVTGFVPYASIAGGLKVDKTITRIECDPLARCFGPQKNNVWVKVSGGELGRAGQAGCCAALLLQLASWKAMPAAVRLNAAATAPRPDPQMAGYINAPYAGAYTLELESTDGSRLYIADKLIVDNGERSALRCIAARGARRRQAAAVLQRWRYCAHCHSLACPLPPRRRLPLAPSQAACATGWRRRVARGA